MTFLIVHFTKDGEVASVEYYDPLTKDTILILGKDKCGYGVRGELCLSDDIYEYIHENAREDRKSILEMRLRAVLEMGERLKAAKDVIDAEYKRATKICEAYHNRILKLQAEAEYVEDLIEIIENEIDKEMEEYCDSVEGVYMAVNAAMKLIEKIEDDIKRILDNPHIIYLLLDDDLSRIYGVEGKKKVYRISDLESILGELENTIEGLECIFAISVRFFNSAPPVNHGDRRKSR